MSELLLVSSSPHIRTDESTKRIMRDVVIALLPATLFGLYNFGVFNGDLRALMVTILSIVSCVGAEALYQYIMKQKVTIDDYSSIVTGLLLAMNLPHAVPYWIPVIGGIFAIIVVKQLFGGLGQNFMNPALAARCFLILSFAKHMTTWQLDGTTMATPLGILKEGTGELPTLMDTFVGTIPGCIGETSVIALLIGAVYLLYRRIINWKIPVFYIGTVAILVVLFSGNDGFDMTYLGYHIFSGGLILGAFFMATDYATSPVTPLGQIIFAIGAGVITAVIRLFGGLPEGVSFSIIFMNLWVPIIERYTIPKAFGEEASHGKK